MSFLDRFRRRSYERKDVVLSMGTLFRWYCYDTGLENPNTMSKKMGLTPISDEVAEMEEEASVDRLSEVEPLLVFLNAIAEINSRVISENQAELLSEKMDSLSEHDLEHLKEHMAQLAHMISLTALVAGFSSAMSTGLIERNGASHMRGDFR